MGLSEKIRKQLINNFKIEQAEHVQNITQGLLSLEKNPEGEERQELLDSIFREAHSLKGAARAVGMTTVEALGHGLEELLLQAKMQRIDFSSELFDTLYQALDAVELTMAQIEEGSATPPTRVIETLVLLEQMAAGGKGEEIEDIRAAELETAVSVQPHELEIEPEDTPAATRLQSVEQERPLNGGMTTQIDETIRVSISKLDSLMAQFSELLAAKIRVEQRLVEMREMQQLASNWNKSWSALQSNYSRLLRQEQNGYNKDVVALIEFAVANQGNLRSFTSQANELSRQFARDNMHLKLIIDELQEEIKRIRMLPLSTITVSFERMVRDLARQKEKLIDLTVVGSDTELDKRVLEQVKDPIIHLLRNAVDHGIENAEARQKAGKSAIGHITLSASQQGNNIVISVGDDGDGLDLDAIRQTAVKKGLYTASEIQKLDDTEAANLIFHSGLSTSKLITDISGRGVGLDVVRQNVEDLHGTLQVDWKPGQGSQLTMTLPLTLASSRGLLVQAGGQTFALPLTTIKRMLMVKGDQIANIDGREAITYEDRPVALVWLEDLLELPSKARSQNELIIVIIGVAEKRLGLVVDALAGEQEIVMKSLGQQLAKVGGLAGATVSGSGEVVLVLHAADLIKLAAQTKSRSTEFQDHDQKDEVKRKSILVVDDSITTRTLEKNILEAAGYQVTLATDGKEALGKLVTGALPSLIVSDINMPRLDGFGMTDRLKRDKRYQQIPVILVSSLDSPSDKTRGIEVGADAYIVKSQFDQGNLLDTIAQLI